MWSLAAWVAWLLFAMQPDRRLAGALAARYFSIETYLGLAVAAAALALPVRFRCGPVYLAVALLAVNEWALKPVMAAARLSGHAAGLSFGAWHGVSAILYIIACLAVVKLIFKGDAV